jgi:hypothetical protein
MSMNDMGGAAAWAVAVAMVTLPLVLGVGALWWMTS